MRAGFYGAFDPWINMYESLRYEADSKTILVGASLSFYSRALDRMLGVTNRFRNSPNTVAAEYQGAVGFWDTFCNNWRISRYLDAWAWAYCRHCAGSCCNSSDIAYRKTRNNPRVYQICCMVRNTAQATRSGGRASKSTVSGGSLVRAEAF